MAGRTQVAQMRVLLVDDNPAYRKALRLILSTTAGLEVVGEAVDGRDCLAQASELKPDVIVLDCSMPEMDGPAAARELGVSHPEMRLIGLSVGDDEDCLDDMKRAGVYAVFSKTVGPEELIDAILGRHGHDQSVSPTGQPE